MRPPDHPLRTRLALAVNTGALPLPGQGDTLSRWRPLADISGTDLSLAKLAEAHWDADAILAELNGQRPEPQSLWGVWCAEPPHRQVLCEIDAQGQPRLTGTKAWCSGAALLTHALVSCRNAEGDALLAAVPLAAPGVQVTDHGWQALGMAATASVEVVFDRAVASWVSEPDAYVQRRGFWAGAIGIAACWWGAARAIGRRVAQSGDEASADAHRLAHLGAIDAALGAGLAALRIAATEVDSDARDLQAVALRTRAIVEQACNEVMSHAGRALGAGPLCQDREFARRMADLPVFLRQSHAERDLAALAVARRGQWEHAWAL